MARPSLLSDDAVTSWLGEHPDWQRDGQTLKRSLAFESFRAAFAFMTHMAMVAEKLDHHPEWFNVYNRVDITLTTHDADGLTMLDTSFAETVDTLVDGAK